MSLDEDNLASSIISEVLEDGNTDDETDQDSTNSATVNINPNQDQTLDQDNVSEFGDDTGDLGSVNVDVPIAIPINLDIPEEEEPPTHQHLLHQLTTAYRQKMYSFVSSRERALFALIHWRTVSSLELILSYLHSAKGKKHSLLMLVSVPL